MLQSFCLSAITAGGFYAIYFFSVIFLTEILGYPYGKMLMINAGMLTVSSLCLPFFGKLGDRVGIKKLLLVSSIGMIVLPYFMLVFALNDELGLTMLFQLILNIVVTMNYAVTPAFIAKLFPTPVRYTGLGISYNLANAAMGGMAPFISLYIIQLTGNKLAPAYYFILLGIVSLIPLLSKDSKVKAIE